MLVSRSFLYCGRTRPVRGIRRLFGVRAVPGKVGGAIRSIGFRVPEGVAEQLCFTAFRVLVDVAEQSGST